uniref:Transposase (Putative), gypsy type n=1 Tax=Tanacetum cinerariifolium TaxID=118510 RepID=A0A6L2L0R6_TANCI|nr:transposase (putative), gypsy type [Tanacetum cinerariifolium]
MGVAFLVLTLIDTRNGRVFCRRLCKPADLGLWTACHPSSPSGKASLAETRFCAPVSSNGCTLEAIYGFSLVALPVARDIKSVLTQKGLDAFCHKFHIPEVVHPQLPGRNQTMHERPAAKIGVYTRFFEFANFRLPHSTFLVDVLRDPLLKSTEFNVDHYAFLVAHPASFWKFPEPFLFLVGMSRYYTLDEDTYHRFFMTMERVVADPTKVMVVARERAEGEEKLLDSTVGRVVSYLPVALARAESELEASVDKLFDEGGSTEQGDSIVSGDHDAEIELVTAVEDTYAGNVTVERPKRPCKKRPAVTDASGSSHPPKKLKGDYGTFSGAATSGKSLSFLKELLASSLLNVKAVETLPFITSSIFASPRRESGDLVDSITGLNLRTIGLAKRFIISLDSFQHSSTNAFGDEVDFIIRFTIPPPVMAKDVVNSHAISASSILVLKTKTKTASLVRPFIFHDSSSVGTIRPDVEGSSHLPRKELSVGSREINFENLHEIREMDYHHLFMEFNVRTARQACLNAEVSMLTEYFLSGRKRLESECDKQADLLKARDEEIENLKAQLLLREAEAAEVHALEPTCFSLHDQVSGYERLKEQIKESQDAQMNILNDKVVKLDVDLLEMTLHLEEKFYPRLLTTISGQRWLLTPGLKLVVVKCLHSSEYLAALGAAMSCAIEKGMQSGLSAGIDHRKAGKSLADVPAYNPAAEADFNFGLPNVLTTVATTTALSTTFASASSVPLITIEDYEISGKDGQEDAQGNVQRDVASFLTIEFERKSWILLLDLICTGLAIPLMYVKWIIRLIVLLLYGITFIGSCPVV